MGGTLRYYYILSGCVLIGCYSIYHQPKIHIAHFPIMLQPANRLIEYFDN